MYVVCAWCSQDMGEKEPKDDQQTSHGICIPCCKRAFGFTDEQIARALAPRTLSDLAQEIVTSAIGIVMVWVACS